MVTGNDGDFVEDWVEGLIDGLIDDFVEGRVGDTVGVKGDTIIFFLLNIDTY